jgi:hypothetical protein
MAELFESKVDIRKSGSRSVTITLDANSGNLTMGGAGADGDVLLKDGSGATRIHLDPGMQTIKIRDASGNLIAELGRNGNLRLGGSAHDGDIEMMRSNGQRTVHVDGHEANLWLGGNGADGDIVMFPSGAVNDNSVSGSTIHLDANAGDIILRNADAAEDFDVADAPGCVASPGDVMVIDDDSCLRVSNDSYDRRVAGVISGAGSYKPGLVLDRQGGGGGRLPVALMGKVFAKVDASGGAITVGDLLTTSDVAGHAMRASDPSRSFGAVIGKALAPLPRGRGLVPILVSLQ